jgi:hypothetical protein
MCNGAVEGSALALRLQRRLLAKACTGKLQSDVRRSSQGVPHELTYRVPELYCLCGYGTPEAGNVSFFPVSQPASIAILHHLSKDEGAHDSDKANEAVASSTAAD